MFGPVVSRALRFVGSEDRREARERAEVAEALGEERQRAAAVQAEERYQDYGVQAVEVLRGGGVPSEVVLAAVSARMDAADRAEQRRRSQERAEQLRSRPLYQQARTHQEILSAVSVAMDWADQ